MRVLLDTNVILDLLLDRAGFVEEATAIWDAGNSGQIEIFIAAITPTTIFYIARKKKGADVARQYIADILAATQICPLHQQVFLAAETLQFNDYEDAVQVASALFSRLDCIVTRDQKDFKNSPLPIYSPSEFLALIR